MKLIFKTLLRLVWLLFATIIFVVFTTSAVLVTLFDWAIDGCVDFNNYFERLRKFLVQMVKELQA